MGDLHWIGWRGDVSTRGPTRSSEAAIAIPPLRLGYQARDDCDDLARPDAHSAVFWSNFRVGPWAYVSAERTSLGPHAASAFALRASADEPLMRATRW